MPSDEIEPNIEVQHACDMILLADISLLSSRVTLLKSVFDFLFIFIIRWPFITETTGSTFCPAFDIWSTVLSRQSSTAFAKSMVTYQLRFPYRPERTFVTPPYISLGGDAPSPQTTSPIITLSPNPESMGHSVRKTSYKQTWWLLRSASKVESLASPPPFFAFHLLAL